MSASLPVIALAGAHARKMVMMTMRAAETGSVPAILRDVDQKDGSADEVRGEDDVVGVWSQDESAISGKSQAEERERRRRQRVVSI